MSQGENWPRHPPTAGLDADPPSELSELSKRENRRMRRAMMRGRPLPPRLARAAVQYAPTLQHQAWVGYLLLVPGVLSALVGAAEARSHRFGSWQPAFYEVAGVGWLLLGAWWIWAARRAGRAVRDGCWPEQPVDHG